MEIIVKKHSNSKRFVPHVNRELGKSYHDKRTYLADMKKAGVEPYDPKSVAKRSSFPYVRSEWANEMLRDISNRKGRKPGERFIEELKKKGYSQESYNKAKEMANERKH